MNKDKCDNCRTTKSDTFWTFEDHTMLCDKCHKHYGKKWQKEIDKNYGRRNIPLIIFLTILTVFILIIGTYAAIYYFFNGYSISGYNKEGFDRAGFNKEGYNTLGYNSEGYDISGYDKSGYDTAGYNIQGYNKFGFNRAGYDSNGYNMNGYDSYGYDRNGFNANGYDRDGYDKTGYNSMGYDKNGYNRNPSDLDKVKKIAEEYNKAHTYSLPDFFVCGDMAIDVWNLIETQGINAQICAGNIDHKYTDPETYFKKMNHAWVLAETTPFKYVAVEATGGYLVYGEGLGSGEVENDLYYSNICFDNPKDFKSFSDLRTEYFQVCTEAKSLTNYWNTNIAGTLLTAATSEFKGRMETKVQECNHIQTELASLMN